MSLKRFSVAIWGLIALPWANAAWTQTQPLTLPEAIQRAVEESPDLSAGQAAVAAETLQRLHQLKPDFELQAQLARAGVGSARVTAAEALTSQSALLAFEDRIAVAEQALQSARADLARWLPNDANRPLAQTPS